MEFYVNLGAYIRKCRKDQGIKLKDLAERIEINNSSLYKIETGQSKVKIENLLAIIKELNMPMDEFLERNGYLKTEGQGGLGLFQRVLELEPNQRDHVLRMIEEALKLCSGEK